MTKDNIGERIKRRRIELKMSQEQLSKLTGYSGRSAIAKIEKSVNGLPQPKIAVFARALRTSEVYLCGVTSDPNWKMPDTDFVLNGEERLIIETYRKATPDKKRVILYLLQLEK